MVPGMRDGSGDEGWEVGLRSQKDSNIEVLRYFQVQLFSCTSGCEWPEWLVIYQQRHRIWFQMGFIRRGEIEMRIAAGMGWRDEDPQAVF